MILSACRRLMPALLMAGAILAAAAAPSPAQDEAVAARQPGPSGLPLPRFVSLKADEVNVRQGPGWDHAVAWVYRRIGLPVEIIAEFDVWRQIRDSEGATGWVFASLLSGRRTALVSPWTENQSFPLHRSADAGSAIRAKLDDGILADIVACDGTWCQVTVSNVTGWIAQEHLWGAYAGEMIK